ncbi:MAG: hypothetical protein E7552_02795 [Ruminococcaceae bacterium]|nr:hypothetical protein [Oscillospiraceae bacterium]
MSNIQLPADVKRAVRKIRWRSIGCSLVWYLLWAVSLWQYYARNSDVHPHWSLLFFTLAVLLLPLWMFRLDKALFDRSWTGEIVKIKYRKMSEIPFLSEDIGRVERRDTAILYVRLPNGKKRRTACRRLWYAADRCYKAGDTVRHIPLVPLPQNLTAKPEGGKLCLMCATLSEDSHEHCAACNHTIL